MRRLWVYKKNSWTIALSKGKRMQKIEVEIPEQIFGSALYIVLGKVKTLLEWLESKTSLFLSLYFGEKSGDRVSHHTQSPFQGHYEFSPNNDENNTFQPNQIEPSINIMIDKPLLLFPWAMIDKDTCLLKEMFHYSSLVKKPLDKWEERIC